MLPTDLATFGAIYSTNGSIWRCHYLTCVFPRHFVAPHHPQPTTPMKSLVVLLKKLSKMAGKSASKPMKTIPNKLPCIVMLPTDLATFGAIYSTNGSIWRCHYLTCVFPRHFVAPHHPQPTTPMKSLVVLLKKLSKMAGKSASKPMKTIPNKLPCITVEWWRIAWKTLCAFSRYTAFNISNRYF